MHSTNPYEPPTASEVAPRTAPASDSARPGSMYLIVPRRTVRLAERCVKCNQAMDVAPLNLRIPAMSRRWMVFVFLMSFAVGGPLIWLVLATWPRVKVTAYFCPAHRQSEVRSRIMFRTLLGGAIGLFIGGIVAGIASPDSLVGVVLILLGGIGFPVAIGYQVLRPKPLMVREAFKKQLWIDGAGPEFLRGLGPSTN